MKVAVRVESSYVTLPVTAPDGPVSVNVPLLIVDGTSDFEKVACGLTVGPTSEAPAVGSVEVTCGPTAAAVVKVQLAGAARVLPSWARAPVDTRAVYVVEYASGALGVSVAVVVASLYATVAGTLPPGPVRVNVDVVSVEGFIGREKVAFTGAVRDTPVAFAAGSVDVTPGGAGSPSGTTSRST